jgi:hypothetical protein
MKNSTLIIIGIVGVAIAYYMLRKPTQKQGKVTKPFKPQAGTITVQAGQEFNKPNTQEQSQMEEDSEFCGCGA